MKMTKGMRRFLGVLFVLYIAALVYGLLFAPQFGRTTEVPHGVNLLPFAEIKRFWKGPESLGSQLFWWNVIGNIVVFLPMGFFVAILVQRRFYGAFAVAVTYIASVCAEILQYVLRVGSFDIDDVILNTLGGVFGVLIAAAVRKSRSGGARKRKK
ncbi:MAG: VanZ family protein [Lachnospiraceae bacterium]|nr:VanZ family protein [Lachnospiraceae bacterium]